MERKHHRKYPRVNAKIAVEVTLGEVTEKTNAFTLGGGGLFLGIAQTIPLGTEITVRFRPAKHLPVIAARTRVLYHEPEKGVGIEFTEIDPKHREMILRLILHRMEERRRYPRAPLATQVEYPDGTQIGFSKDISAGGMFIELTTPVPAGSRINLLFHLDDGEDAVKTDAEVLYAVLKLGIGVSFVDLSPSYYRRIEAYVAKATS